MAEATAVSWDVEVQLGKVVTTLRAPGVSPIPITVDPQAAFEMAEKLARAAHEARFGTPIQSDESYLREQIRKRVTEDYRKMLVRKFEIITTSMMREPQNWPPLKVANELVDIALQRILPS